MTQLPLTARTVPMRHVQGSEPLAIPADALCVLAPGHDAARDHVVRDDAPRGRAWVAGDVPEGATVWVQADRRWRAMVRVGGEGVMQLSLCLEAPRMRERAPDEPPPVVIRGLQRDQVVIVDGIRHEVRGVDEDGPCWCPVGVSTEEGFRALLWEEVEEIAPGRWRTLASVMEAAS